MIAARSRASWPSPTIATPALLALLAHSAAVAQSVPSEVPASGGLDSVVVSATRLPLPSFELPASIDLVGREAIGEARLRVSISESLGAVPGLLARERQNQAQDVQLSIRGFGARSSFGIRGLRIYVDGIPATMADGQGQVSHIDLASAARIEVLRGPFSALHGNSSGGVIEVFSEDGSGPPVLGVDLGAGSYGALRAGSRLVGASGPVGYALSLGRSSTDGYREHSESLRTQGNARLVFGDGGAGRWTLVANTMDLRLARDPLGLPRDRFEPDPRGVVPAALAFDPRKQATQTQAGLIHERELDEANALRLMAYAGQRQTEQYLPVPVAAQLAPTSAGGVIDLDRQYGGLDLRWTWRPVRGPRPLTLVAGLAYDALAEQRLGFENFVGTSLGVRGALRRDEENRASGFDRYLQASWLFSPRWSLDAGLRRSSTRIVSADRYVVGANGDDSGATRFDTTLPTAGLMYRVSDRVHVYAAAARGFETPTINELSYRPDGAAGLNLELRPARSVNGEIGVKAALGGGLGRLEAALFRTRTRDEIVTQTNAGGRASFGNAGGTLRRGVELAWSNRFARDLAARVALTRLDAIFSEAFLTCAAAPCTVPDLEIPAGNAIPGVSPTVLFASIDWTPPEGWRGGLEARHLGRVAVDDRNSDHAPSYTLVGAHLGYVARFGAWELRGFGRLDNLFDRRYAGSVIVNEANARFFEPAPGRNWIAGVSASFGF
ncbi:MAG TPA: TonB-dependent receptor [Quisquiliibacterium sp.]|nr:TonB-dependent receptor [Quisquiliibacterium sp.]